ncbi:putative ribonuclease H-like domain-containing protein [Tanacetum coccineum]|uniref:Ribonuclease H-like domain-containing protein n=1 Tax=Tanacetum coccineum TaxID=301880 RepID=A0ABQ5GWE0_9ASTR
MSVGMRWCELDEGRKMNGFGGMGNGFESLKNEVCEELGIESELYVKENFDDFALMAFTSDNEYKSDSDDDYEIRPSKEQVTPSYAFVNIAKHVKTPREPVNVNSTYSQSPGVDKRDWNGRMSKTLALKTTFTKQKVNSARDNSVSTVGENMETAENPPSDLEDEGIVDSGCSRHMTGNKEHLDEYQDIKGSLVTFGGSKGRITSKGKIRTGKLDFENVYFVKELGLFNLFSVSQICDKRNRVLFSESECLVLSPDFKMPDECQVLLKIPESKIYSFNLGDLAPKRDLACLVEKATINESNKWHRRLGHKGKQHKASCKAKTMSSISQPLQILHMDLFGPTFVRSINHKRYCLVITDDFSKFSWVFFLGTKDETSVILQDFITQIENQLDKRVKVIRCDNGTEFKNRDIFKFCGSKGIKREYSNARTPQQSGVVERKNRTLIEAARTMLADSLLPNTFWAEAVNTACYVLNRVLVTKPQNKTPYELLTAKIPIISYIRPFGCRMTILNTIDHLGKFDGKVDEGFLVKYSLSSKAFRVYNLVTKIVEENLHVNFLENKPNITGKGPEWLFDIDYLTDSMNYHPVRTENQANHTAGPQEVSNSNADLKSSELKNGGDKPKENTAQEQEARDAANLLERTFTRSTEELLVQEAAVNISSTTRVNPGSTPVNSASTLDPFIAAGPSFALYDDEGAVVDFTNLDSKVNVSPIPTKRIHSIHPQNQILGDPKSAVDVMQEELLQFDLQKVWILVDLPFRKKEIGTKWVYNNKKDDRGVVVRNKARLVALGHKQEECIDYDEVFAPVARIEAIRIFLAFASYMGFMVYQIDVKSAFLYGKIDKEMYVKQPPGFEDPKFPKKVYKVVKALYGLHQAPRAWYATLSLFLLKNGYRRGTIDKTLFLKKDKKDIILIQVYVDDIIFGSTRKSWCDEFEALMKSEFQMSSMGELTFFLGLQVKQRNDGIFISQDKYVAEILKKFDFVNVKTASTPIETQKPLVKDEEANDVDVHLYRSMIGSLMYLTTSRPDIMFVVCACSRFQITLKTSYLKAVKRIFRYLKGKPKLGLWYPRVSSFDLEAFSDSDYAGANLDRKSITGGCQFLGKRLISWQCKKQTIVATSTTEDEYVATANCC